MNKAEELNNQIIEEMLKYKVSDTAPWLRKIDKNGDFYRECTNAENNCKFYQWLACLIRVKKPKLVCELGADKGGSAVFILSELPENGRLYSFDTGDRPGKWSYVPSWDKRILAVEGDDLDPTTYPVGFPMWDVDVWFVDSDHNPDHVTKLMKLISPFFKPGAVVINHDVYLFGLIDIIKSYPFDYWDDNRTIFTNGVSLQVV